MLYVYIYFSHMYFSIKNNSIKIEVCIIYEELMAKRWFHLHCNGTDRYSKYTFLTRLFQSLSGTFRHRVFIYLSAGRRSRSCSAKKLRHADKSDFYRKFSIRWSFAISHDLWRKKKWFPPSPLFNSRAISLNQRRDRGNVSQVEPEVSGKFRPCFDRTCYWKASCFREKTNI